MGHVLIVSRTLVAFIAAIQIVPVRGQTPILSSSPDSLSPPPSPIGTDASPGRTFVAFESADARWTGAVLVDDGHKGRAARFGSPGAKIEVGEFPIDGSRPFTLEVAIRTSRGEFSTILMARDGGNIGLSLVMGRIPGYISFESWSWQEVQLFSTRRLDDGAWHVVKVVYAPKGTGASMWVDGRFESFARMGPGGSPNARLRLGDNIGADQAYRGDLDEFSYEQHAEASELEAIEFLGSGPTDGHRIAELRDWRERLNPMSTPVPASASDWTVRRSTIRAGVLDALGLTPLPPREDLSATVHGGLSDSGVRVERVSYASWPGYRATAWLWTADPTVQVAENGPARRPGMLMPHGHWAGGAVDPLVQVRAARFARAGYVVVVPDSVHAEETPSGVSSGGVMTWNNIRALDYILSRTDIDPTRVGVTGASGGGQQTQYLMAIEDRLAAAAPVCMVAYFNNYLADHEAHCECNHVPRMARVADAPEIAACFSPRASLFISSTRDWTATFEERGLPEIRRLYALAGAPDNARSRRFDAPHGYDRDMRTLAYSFFDSLLTPPNPAASEAGFSPFGTRELLALGPRPHAPPISALGEEFLARRGPSTLFAVASGIDWTIMPRWPKDDIAVNESKWNRSVLAGAGGVHISVLTHGVNPDKIAADGSITLVVPSGSPAGLVLAPPAWLVAPAAIVEPRLLSSSSFIEPVINAWKRNGLLLGCGEGYAQANDIAQVIASLPGPGKIRLVAMGSSGVPALIAATISPRVERLVIERLGPTYAKVPNRSPMCPEVRRLGDLPGLLRAVTPGCVVTLGGAPGLEGGREGALTHEEIAQALR